ncbi:SIR2 family protein [Bradyrhizobium sp. SZCCHNRI3042]|uniref:SIR2 family protein n=1 Tax=Bradyrhizobium sp. SZCCHNRI3042 TaxID=3057291 RepID=UPI002915C965|nr:SIR2 family protein [Bradyrhizobium sp. SZCCHNRI3042]
MSGAPHAASITVRETLDLLDGALAEVASGITEDRYALWLGSGISLGRIPGLKLLIRNALEHLQGQVVVADPDCRFRSAITEILSTAAGLSPAECATIDVHQPVANWPNIDAVVQRLASNYARFLEIGVAGEPDDYILWTGADLPNVFADPNAEPDAEHLCIGLLILEGIASRIASANWDGLIEKAVSELSPGTDALVVCVTGADLRQPQRQAFLYKFHGCAVRARDDEANFRHLIIARLSQINAWRDDQKNAAMVARLVDLAVSHETLMIGLSAQDSNIQTVFTAAENQMGWPWPSHPPAYAFSEDRLGVDQRALLRNVYRGSFTPANRDAIYQSALIRAYAKPLLTALVLHVLCAKLCRLVDLAPGGLGIPDSTAIKEGLKHLRNALGSHPDAGAAAFIRMIVAHTSRLTALYHTGDATASDLPYLPITSRPVQAMGADPMVATAGLRELAVGLSLLGLGQRDGSWALQPSALPASDQGALRIVTSTNNLKLIFASNAQAAIRLGANGHIGPDDDVIVVHSQQVLPAMPRSPRATRGRLGRPGRRDVSVTELLDSAANANELFDAFRKAAGI